MEEIVKRGAEALETSVDIDIVDKGNDITSNIEHQTSNVEHQTSNIKFLNEYELRDYIRKVYRDYGVIDTSTDVEHLTLNELGQELIKELYKERKYIKLVENEIENIRKEFKNKNKMMPVEDNTDYLVEIEAAKKLGLGETFVDKRVITMLQVTEKGVLKSAQSNYTTIVKFDKYIQSHVKYNELKRILEFDGRPFTNSDYTIIATYFSSVYNLENRNMIINSIVPDNLISYNPVKDAIERDIDKFELEDGVSYIDNFFKEICGYVPEDDDDNDYQREVARMIFYGGINRLYNPGCKFDYMPIFVGRQGCGKSSIVDMLNPIRSSFVDLRTIDGKEAIELIQGGFVIELSELLAFVRSKDAESMKSFVTRSVDKYRPAYERLSEERPRTCILIGTTNDAAFLTDITGNRRYLPIGLYDMSAKFIFENLDFVKDYIDKCWKEALILMRRGKTYLHIPYEYNDVINRYKDRYTLEDPLVEEVRNYVNNIDNENRCSPWRICAKELYEKCANGVGKCPTYMFKQFRNIMSTMDGWVWDTHKPHKMKGYEQKQRCWVNHKLREKYSPYDNGDE